MNSMPRNGPPRSTPSTHRFSRQIISNMGMTFPLSEIVAAHEAVEQGRVLGNVVVKIS